MYGSSAAAARSCRRPCGRPSTAPWRDHAVRRRPLGRAVSEHLGHERRRRHVQQHLDAEPLRAVRLLRLRHEDARPRLPAVGRASSLQRDQARSRRELGLQRAADRRGRPASPEAVAFEINASKNITIANYHAYRVTRNHAPAPAAVRDLRAPPTSASATCTPSRRAATASATTNGCGTLPARGQVSLRECDPGRDASPRGARARVRRARHRRPGPRVRRPADASAVVARRRSRSWRAASSRSPAPR